MNFVDTHAHLFWESFEQDLDQTLDRAKQAGLKAIINVGVDIDLSDAAAKIAILKSTDSLKLYSSIAIHPEEAIRYYNNEEQINTDISKLEEIYSKNKDFVIAVGECGLDFAYFNREGYLKEGLTPDKAKQLQRQLFAAQIKLAKKLNLPLLIHCRDDRSQNFQNTECWDEIIELTKDWKGIYHCYSGLLPTTNYLLQATNFLVSFAGNLTYPKNDYLKQAVEILPLERIVLETDCPFLPPQSIRGKRNEPSSVREIAQLIAEIKNVPLEKVAEITTDNFSRLFELK